MIITYKNYLFHFMFFFQVITKDVIPEEIIEPKKGLKKDNKAEQKVEVCDVEPQTQQPPAVLQQEVGNGKFSETHYSITFYYFSNNYFLYKHCFMCQCLMILRIFIIIIVIKIGLGSPNDSTISTVYLGNY